MRAVSLLERMLLTALTVVGLLYLPAHIERAFAPELVILAPARTPGPAPLYSKRCMARDRDFAAGQADGGPWQGTCTTKRIAL